MIGWRAGVLAVALIGVALISTVARAQDVRQPTRTALLASPAPSTQGQPVTLTATVAPNTGNDRPVGGVEFSAGPRQLGLASLAREGAVTATLEVASLPVGRYQITARYLGHPAFLPSVSPPVEHAVNPQH